MSQILKLDADKIGWTILDAMDRSLFAQHAVQVAPQLLGAILAVDSPEGVVKARITEVEAYMGLGTPGVYDPGSHSKDRKTQRNQSMFLSGGHAYVYASYGMHFALNIVCSPAGVASGVLVRSAEIIEGGALARSRRLTKRAASNTNAPIKDSHLARGPGNLATALGITRAEHDGRDLFAEPFHMIAPLHREERVSIGPRVGVSGRAGGSDFPWRYWITGDPTVSAFRAGRNAPR